MGRISGDDFVDRQVSKQTSLRVAIDLYEQDGLSKDANNKRSKLRYWRSSKFADWSLVAIRPLDLVKWRKAVLDEENAEDGEPTGPGAECSAQTVVHRLNALSLVYKHWIMHRDRHVENPVIEGVRRSLGHGRDRRLKPGEEPRLLKALERSSRWWLKPAVIILIETTMRQAELAGLDWERVRLEGDSPHVSLHKTKNDRARTAVRSSSMSGVSTAQDRPALLSCRIVRRIFQTPPLAPHVVEETAPGPHCVSDADFESFLRDNAVTIFHPAGTCRMGRDAMAVVDDRLRVHGIAGLRVIDASIMPTLVSGNINAPVIAIAERAADIIRKDRKGAPHGSNPAATL